MPTNDEPDLVKETLAKLQKQAAAPPAKSNPPQAVKPLAAVAKGYQYYLNYLKQGGSSQISAVFGKAADILDSGRLPPPPPPAPVDECQLRLDVSGLPEVWTQVVQTWSLVKPESRDVFELSAKFQQELSSLNRRLKQRGVLNAHLNLLGLTYLGNPEQGCLLLASVDDQQSLYAVEPVTGQILGRFRFALLGGQLSLSAEAVVNE